MNIIKNNLSFRIVNGQYVCDSLANLPQEFETRADASAVEADIASLLTFMRSLVEFRHPTEAEHNTSTQPERLRMGTEVWDEVMEGMAPEINKLSLFDRFLFWMGDWWYYHPTFRAKCLLGSVIGAANERAQGVVSKHILSILPPEIRNEVGSMKVANCVSRFGHFAILFRDDSCVRRVITDTQLIEVRDVSGYNYLDLAPDGRPIFRCCTPHGGGRAFFDGVRMMAHSRFQTCAPKTVIFDGGYKVNSTGVSIINGSLYPLIDADDAVAKTTGMWCPFFTTFSVDEQLASFASSEASAARLKVEGISVKLDGVEIKPLGSFKPSDITLLKSGFSHYEWSEFVPVETT